MNINFDNFNNFNQIKDILSDIPLYKQRGKEEVFLGIKKSCNRKWIGFKIIKDLKKKKQFPDQVNESGLYDLAIYYWSMYLNNKKIKIENLKALVQKMYNF